ncbi:hypothetical protein EDD16DRAFT_871305 [Pisolithus croceorrhizus]|nr:hypothetical protein F5141DRAFT_532923 [Pisolithus sp. B1]KAI6131666.1 hypothetical protein EDD16DRAFT_871305 [Pisolithus croceorrhizus]KAI6134547.1 hypothetical protein EV401DRAFT_1905818 [Pisolithus croceorrhizus]
MSPWSPSTPSSSLPVVDDDRSHLLSESLPSYPPQDTGPGGADLSLSELSLADRPLSRDGPRFSLLAPQPVYTRDFSYEESAIAEDGEFAEDSEVSTDTQRDADNETIRGPADSAKAREEKLQRDLLILKRLNDSFAVLNDALSTTRSATEQVAEQLAQTDALLDKYANMLSKSEGVTRLIFDERWEGAEADEDTIARERAEASERARLEQERAEALRREAEERAQQQASAAAVVAKTTSSRARGATTSAGSGVRGVRGTRATAAAAIAARGAGRGSISRGGSAPSSRGGIPRPSSAAGRASGVPRGISRRG